MLVSGGRRVVGLQRIFVPGSQVSRVDVVDLKIQTPPYSLEQTFGAQGVGKLQARAASGTVVGWQRGA